MMTFFLSDHTASRILENMDTNVAPCDDFYEFACGGWAKSKHINDDQTGITEFGALREDLNRKLRSTLRFAPLCNEAPWPALAIVILTGYLFYLHHTALVEKPTVASEPNYSKWMRMMYRQCMNTS